MAIFVAQARVLIPQALELIVQVSTLGLTVVWLFGQRQGHRRRLTRLTLARIRAPEQSMADNYGSAIRLMLGPDPPTAIGA
jgi:hypothetical protein